jgi:transcriptional regulator with XRE-family HTH domain
MAMLYEIGWQIKRRRIELGMTQDLLARASGLSRATIIELESGTIKDLSFNRTSRVLSVLGLGLGTSAASKRPRANALRIAAQTASVSFRTRLDPALLQQALTDGHVPPQAIAHIGTLLDEAPPSLLAQLVTEVSRRTTIAPAAIWSNMKRLATSFMSPRDLWQ